MWHNNDAPLFDRIVAVGSYFTLGTVGIIWILVNALLLRRQNSKYLIFNLIQSFIISILFAIISLAYGIFIGILVNLPFIGKFFLKMHIFILKTPVFNTMSLVNYVIFLFLIYLSVIACFGKLPFVPFVTDITKKLHR